MTLGDILPLAVFSSAVMSIMVVIIYRLRADLAAAQTALRDATQQAARERAAAIRWRAHAAELRGIVTRSLALDVTPSSVRQWEDDAHAALLRTEGHGRNGTHPPQRTLTDG